jgi:hypothetical protein
MMGRARNDMVRVIDDAELLRLAAEPPRDVAPMLRRAVWFLPLVILSAVAPPLIAATRAALGDEAAGWGLRALSVRQARQLSQWLAPATGWPDVPMNFAPPLHVWLTAPVLGVWSPGMTGPLLAVACVCVMAGIAITYLFADETGGARWALIAALALALHPQLMSTAQSGGPEALSFVLLVVTSWGLWGHLNDRRDLVSFRLLTAGIAWGLLLLASGPLAIAFVVVATVWTIWSRFRTEEPGRSRGSRSATSLRFALSSLGILVGTGGALGCWWLAMMFAEAGWPFLSAWLIGQSGPQPLPWGLDSPQESLQQWLHRSIALGGWWLVGLVTATKLGWSRRQSPEAELARWLVAWNVCAATVRFALYFAAVEDPGVIRLWETFALFPATLLAAQGLNCVLQREASWRLILMAIMVMIGQVCWMATGTLSIGLIVGAAFGVLVLASAPLALGLRRSTLAWSEAEIRRWVAVAAMATVVGHAAMGWYQTRPDADRATWLRVRQRLQAVDNISQASFIAPRRSDGPQLWYLARALWPQAVLSQASEWDPKLTETLIRERDRPTSRMVIVDRSGQDLRLQGLVGSGWQLTTLVEPEPYHGRRLAVHLLAPVKR